MKRKFRVILFVLALSAYIATLNTCSYDENFSSTKGVHYGENNIKLLGTLSDSNLAESPSVVNNVNDTNNNTGNTTDTNSTSPTDTTNSSSGSNSQSGTTNSNGQASSSVNNTSNNASNSTVSGGRLDSDNDNDMGNEASGTQAQASQSTSQSNPSTSTNTQSNNSRTVKKKNSTNTEKDSSNTTNTSKEENLSSPIVNNVTEKPKNSETLLVKSSIEKGDINLNDSSMLIKLSCEDQNFKELYYSWSQNKEVKHEEIWTKYVEPLTFNKTGVWYLHYKAIDKNENETYGYFGPYNAVHIYKTLSTNNSNETMGKKIVAYAAILVIVAVAAVYLIKTNKFTLAKKKNDES